MHYRWHTLHGQTLPLFRRDKQGRVELLFCELPTGRIVGIPAWMTDPASASYSLGPPVIAVEALEALRELLSAIRGAGEIGLTVLDNQRVREEGYETIRTRVLAQEIVIRMRQV